MNRQMNRQVAFVRAKFSSVSVSGIAEARRVFWSAPRTGPARARSALFPRPRLRAKLEHARCYRDRDLFRPQTAKLFTHCRPDRQITRMQAGHILAGISGGLAFSNDGIQIQRAVLMIRAPAGQWLRISSGIREPAYRQTGQLAIRFRPRKVSRSAAPGPAPIKCTVICVLLQPRHKQPARHLRFALYIPVWQGL